MSDQRFPLHWPQGWPRTKSPIRSRFRVTFSKARRELFEELGKRRLNATDIILSTDIPLKTNGEPYAVYRLEELGVAVYFKYKGRPMVLACDKFDKIEDNIYSVAQTIRAIRSIERWGASEMMERAFTGFQALPDPTDWKAILGDQPNFTSCEKRYRELAKEAHPDAGGSTEAMSRLNDALSKAREAFHGRAS